MNLLFKEQRKAIIGLSSNEYRLRMSPKMILGSLVNNKNVSSAMKQYRTIKMQYSHNSDFVSCKIKTLLTI